MWSLLGGALVQSEDGHQLQGVLALEFLQKGSSTGQCQLPLVLSLEVLERVYHVSRGQLPLVPGLKSFGGHYNVS